MLLSKSAQLFAVVFYYIIDMHSWSMNRHREKIAWVNVNHSTAGSGTSDGIVHTNKTLKRLILLAS